MAIGPSIGLQVALGSTGPYSDTFPRGVFVPFRYTTHLLLPPMSRWHTLTSGLQDSDAMSERQLFVYGAISLTTIIFVWRWLVPGKHQLKHIPALGPTAPILSYWGALQWMLRGADITVEGYKKYKGRPFKIAEFNRWVVVVSGRDLVDELRKAGDDELSFLDAANQDLEIPFTCGKNIAENIYHIPLIRGQLTRNINSVLPDVRDEVAAAFADVVPPTLGSKDWTPVVAYGAIMQIVSRTANRVFVGLPICRESDYIDLTVQHTIDVVVGAKIISLFPDVLKPLAAHFLTKVSSSVARGLKHLGPTIEERLQAVEEYGKDYPNKPNDMLSWLIDEAQGEERTVKNLVLRILVVNFAAIHTSTISFMMAFYHLAAHPECVQPLRDEIEDTVKDLGWCKQALDKMHKLDSFLRESQRFYSMSGVVMNRKARKDFTFSDGTFIPKGTFVSAANLPMHHDEEYYEDAGVFKPWRFSDMRAKEDESFKYMMVSTGIDYVPFGHGRHACPGRFFAAAELKSVLAHLVTHYDVKMEEEGVIPPLVQFGQTRMPNNKAKVFFRKRQ